MSKIIDTVSGLQATNVLREPSNAIFTDMVQLEWTRSGGETMKVIFPRKTAHEFMEEHLIPQQQQGLLINVGIHELEPLGTN
jgi:hypothetical protein